MIQVCTADGPRRVPACIVHTPCTRDTCADYPVPSQYGGARGTLSRPTQGVEELGSVGGARRDAGKWCSLVLRMQEGWQEMACSRRCWLLQTNSRLRNTRPVLLPTPGLQEVVARK